MAEERIQIKKFLIGMILFLICNYSFSQQRENRLEVKPITFETHEGKKQSTDAEEGFFYVPENRKNPKSNIIKLHFVRFKSTNPNPGNPVIYLAGGPGGSGSYSAAGDRFQLFMAMREVGDVIAFDQRGTYKTEPYLVCPEPWDYPLDKPLNKIELNKILLEWATGCNNHWKEKGVDLGAYNTDESASDIEDLRTALGQDKFNLWGISYGTHLAMNFIKKYPTSVDKAVLAGVEGLDQTNKLPEDLNGTLNRLNKEIKNDKIANSITPDFIGSMKSIFDKLDENPVTVSMKDPKTKKNINVVVGKLDAQVAFYENMNERHDIQNLPLQISRLEKGEYELLASWAMDYRKKRRELAMTYLMDCSSGSDEKRIIAISQQEKTSLLGEALNLYGGFCNAWDYENLPDSFRTYSNTEVPVLFIVGSLDGRTPIENIDAFSDYYKNSQTMIIERGGHDDDLFIGDNRILDNILRFLKNGTIKDRIINRPPIKFSKKL